MKATTRRGAAGALPVKTTKKKKAAGGFMCGCGGSKSVSIVVSRAAAANISAVTTPLTASSTTTKATSASTAKTAAAPASHDADVSAEATPSVDALLRQLRELERGVRALGVREDGGARGSVLQSCSSRRPRHRRSASDWEGGRGRLEEESVAVVTESADPLGDFRRSMVQMVVENEITGAADLRELLQRFLSLNSARHHHLILRAFADVWEELFAGGHPLPRPQKSRMVRILRRDQKKFVVPRSSTISHCCRLFCDGKIIPQLQEAEIWLEIAKKLMPDGRIMVNCGGADAAVSLARDTSPSSWVQNPTIKALCSAFPGQLNWKRLSEKESVNYVALTGPLPDLDEWSASVPSELSAKVKQRYLASLREDEHFLLVAHYLLQRLV